MNDMSINDCVVAVKAIKTAILQSRYRAAVLANAEMLSLYYGIGAFVSRNSREGLWGSGAIESISNLLKQELPTLKGFSASNIKNMRIFYEEWVDVLNRQSVTGEIDNNQTLPPDTEKMPIRQTVSGEIDVYALSRYSLMDKGHSTNAFVHLFLRIGFSHHTEILLREKSTDGRLFYIAKCSSEFWSVRMLRSRLQEKLFEKQGKLPNNFALTIPQKALSAKAVEAFKDEYLLDFINIEDTDTPDENPSIGLILCQDMKHSIVELAIRDFNKPMGVAVYRTSKNVPEAYRSLIPVIEGVRAILNSEDESTHTIANKKNHHE